MDLRKALDNARELPRMEVPTLEHHIRNHVQREQHRRHVKLTIAIDHRAGQVHVEFVNVDQLVDDQADGDIRVQLLLVFGVDDPFREFVDHFRRVLLDFLEHVEEQIDVQERGAVLMHLIEHHVRERYERSVANYL